MDLILYTSEDSEYNAFLLEDSEYKTIIKKCKKEYFGNKIYVDVSDEGYIEEFSKKLCYFICEVYLKESVLLKIYDEYPCIDSHMAAKIMLEIFGDLSVVEICRKIKEILCSCRKINIESFVLFNIRYIMSTIYKLADKHCEKYVMNMKRLAFERIVHSFFLNCTSECDEFD